MIHGAPMVTLTRHFRRQIRSMNGRVSRFGRRKELLGWNQEENVINPPVAEQFMHFFDKTGDLRQLD